MGLTCGFGQLIVYQTFLASVSPYIIFPLTGLVIGYITHCLSLFIIFNPGNPIPTTKRFSLQGLFLKRQREASVVFSKIVTATVLNVEKAIGHLKETGRWADVLSLFDMTHTIHLNQLIQIRVLPEERKRAIIESIRHHVHVEIGLYLEAIAKRSVDFIESRIQLKALLSRKLI